MKIIEDIKEAKKLLARQGPSPDILETDDREQAVRRIIDDVGRRDDAALFYYTEKFDGVKLASLEVPAERIAAARAQVAPELLAALELAAGRISAYHKAQMESLAGENTEKGVGWLVRPLGRVGVYIPGGRAFYPSTVLMTVIPAKVAGVAEVIMVTPPAEDGTVNPVTLASAGIAGADRVFSIGGAQAVAALAFGTETVPAVDKVCGPGNIFVQIAKQEVSGIVGIDAVQGPSEVMIIADETADPAYCASDMLAQAEHDPMASAVLVTTSRQLAGEVVREAGRQIGELSRREVAAESIERNGMIAVVKNLDGAVELANLYAPEHLLLMVKDASSYIEKIDNAGCIVTGGKATVALGDYIAGPSHALPTGGTARFGSPLNATDFLKITSVIDTDKLDFGKLGSAAMTIAEAEGLEAHAKAIEKRLRKD